MGPESFKVNGKRVSDSIMKKLTELRALEVSLGHLPPENWALSELQRRVNDPDFPFQAAQMEQKTELLFGDICDDLHQLGFTVEEIARVINSQIKYPGGPKYCNEEEVSDTLGLKE